MHDRIINLQDHHFFINAAPAIDAIMQPLKPFGVHFFSYIKNYSTSSGNSQVYLSNKAQWVKDYYALKLYKTSLFEKAISHYSTGNILWPVASDLAVYAHGKNYYNSDYGITFIVKSEDFCEFYFFSSANQPSVNLINFYHHHIDIFERFIIYFKDRAEKIINKAEKYKIEIFQPEVISTEDNINILQAPEPNKKQLFVKATKLYHYTFNSGELKGIKLSTRELDCLINVADNLSASESAKRLNLSPRTVESYLNNVKLKLGCNKREELLEKLSAHHLNLEKIIRANVLC